MPKKWSVLLNMRKLTERQLNRCKILVDRWERIKEICYEYWVSSGYLYYHWIRKHKKRPN